MKNNLPLVAILILFSINAINAQLIIGTNVGYSKPQNITAISKTLPEYNFVNNFKSSIPFGLSLKYKFNNNFIGINYTTAKFKPNSDKENNYEFYSFDVINLLFERTVFKEKNELFNLNLGCEFGLFFTEKKYKKENDGSYVPLILALSPKISFNYFISSKLMFTSELKMAISFNDNENKPENLNFNIGLAYNLSRKK